MRSSTPLRGRPSRVAVPLACLAVLLAACGTAQRTATLPQQTPTGSAAPTSTAEVDVDRSGMEPATVTGVRYATHGTYDRVVVDLKGGIPGYSVKWVDELVQDGSGKPIDVNGGAYLQLTLFPANAHDEEGTPTWTGGPVYQARLRNLADVVRTGDFEARVGIGLVLGRKAPFRVTEQGSLSRLVLDVAH
ncbi:AMIN-like domain-containing (lipo)protein [Nonomuraea rubra]